MSSFLIEQLRKQNGIPDPKPSSTSDFDPADIQAPSSPSMSSRNRYSKKLKQQKPKISSNRKALYIHGQRWYYRLVKSREEGKARAVMEDYNLATINKKLVVAYTPGKLFGRDFLNQQGDANRIYTVFDSYVKFYKYLDNFPVKHFHEVIFGDLPQKIRFDIDLDIEQFKEKYPEEKISEAASYLLHFVLSGIDIVLTSRGIKINPERDFLIFTSSDYNIEKYSYHIIVDNYYHENNIEARAFCMEVIKEIPKYSEFIDKGVYNSKQHFRMIKSCKYGSTRVKKFCSKFEYNQINYVHQYTEEQLDDKDLSLFLSSLISFTSGSDILPPFAPVKKIIEYGIENDISEEIANNAMELLEQILKNDSPFEIQEIKGSLIILKRLGPSYCPVCKKIHDKQHPYMIVSRSKVLWNCRRNDPGKHFTVGFIDSRKFENIKELSDDENFQSGFYFGEQHIDQMNDDFEESEEDFEPVSISIFTQKMESVEDQTKSRIKNQTAILKLSIDSSIDINSDKGKFPKSLTKDFNNFTRLRK